MTNERDWLARVKIDVVVVKNVYKICQKCCQTQYGK